MPQPQAAALPIHQEEEEQTKQNKRKSNKRTKSTKFTFSPQLQILFVPTITKTHLYNFDPLKPHFNIVKLGFTGVYIIYLISAQNIDCGYSLEPPRRGGSNEYPQSIFWVEIWKISGFFIWKFLIFMVVKFSIYLNRRVFVMDIWAATLEMYRRTCAPSKDLAACAFAVCSESSLGAYWIAKDTRFFHVNNKDWSDCAEV